MQRARSRVPVDAIGGRPSRVTPATCNRRPQAGGHEFGIATSLYRAYCVLVSANIRLCNPFECDAVRSCPPHRPGLVIAGSAAQASATDFTLASSALSGYANTLDPAPTALPA